MCPWKRVKPKEFLLVAPHLDLTGSKRLAEKVRLAAEAAQFDKNIHLTVSIGVAEWTPGQSLETLIDLADKALYQAKASGRNQVVGWTAGDPQQHPNTFH